jgi:hypothetical protein
LRKFFDPQDGQVTQRLAAFVDDQGVLAHLLDKYLAPQNSVLAQTLARQVGEYFSWSDASGSWRASYARDHMNALFLKDLAQKTRGLGLAGRGAF